MSAFDWYGDASDREGKGEDEAREHDAERQADLRTLTVWHRDDPDFRSFDASVTACGAFPAGFTRVARVRVPDCLDPSDPLALDLAYSWTRRGVVATKLVPHAARSTSVGDVIVDGLGRRWFVDSIGFEVF